MQDKGELCDSQPPAHTLSLSVLPGVYGKALLCYLLHSVMTPSNEQHVCFPVH